MLNKIILLAFTITTTTPAFAFEKCDVLAQNFAKAALRANGTTGALKSIVTNWQMTEGDLDLWKIEVLSNERNHKRLVTSFEVVTGQSEGPCQIQSLKITGASK